MRLLYVQSDGVVRRGNLDDLVKRPCLTSRAGEPLGPDRVSALLVPPDATETERQTLARAAEAGYRVERL